MASGAPYWGSMKFLENAVPPGIRAVCLLALAAGGCATGGTGGTSGFGPGSASNGSSASGTGGSSGSAGSTAGTTGSGSATATASGGSTAGTTSAGSTTAASTGAMCSRWRVDVPGSVLWDVEVGDDGTVYAAGLAGGTEAHVLALDPCDGAIVQEQKFIHGNHVRSELLALALSSDGLFVAGRTYPTDPESEGLYARLDPTTLELDWTSPLFGSLEKRDSISRMTLTPLGRVWMGGSVGAGANMRPWWVSGSTTGQGCGFGAGITVQAASVGLASDASAVYSIIDVAGGGVQIARFDPTCTCMCDPLSVSPVVDIGMANTAPQDIILSAGTLYGVGSALDDAMGIDHRTVGVAIDAATGSLLAQVTTNPTAKFDVDFGAVVGDGTLYVARTIGWDGANIDDTGAQGYLVAYDLPLTAGEVPAWEVPLMGVNGALKVARDSAGGAALYVTGVSAGQAVIVSCDPDGTCG